MGETTMNKIPEHIEQRIKAQANIMDVMDDLGVTLHRSGSSYDGLCPFHDDRHLGSFKVSESKNIATCFSCGKSWSPIDALMEGLHIDYPTALRHLAAKYHIFIDSEPVPFVKVATPRHTQQLPMIYWEPKDVVKPYLGKSEHNPLLKYLYALPLKAEDAARLKDMAENAYFVGTSTATDTYGWTIWWQIDDQMRVRTGKLMAYKSDGHRNKDIKYSFNFVHSLLAKAGKWDPDKAEFRSCLFGLHLVDVFQKAEVCIVESEKTALICSAFTDPAKRLWMATAGKSQLTRRQLQPLIDRKRYIVLYPDYDGYDEWVAAAKRIGYNRLSVSRQVRDLHIEQDGDKADIADIMLRLVNGCEESDAQKVARRLGSDNVQAIANMMEKLDLTISEDE